MQKLNQTNLKKGNKNNLTSNIQSLTSTKGITLIALVITVIVLLILAGVTISLVVGDNGIITKAKEAKQNMANAQEEEEQQLQNLENYITELGGNGTNSSVPTPPIEQDPTPEAEKFSLTKAETNTQTTLSDGTVWVPKGFYAGESSDVNTITGGFVITDAVDAYGNSTGNEFVWVPVTTYAQNFTYTSPSYSPKASNTRDESLPGEITKDLIETKGGFYIARYEAGDSEATTAGNARTTESSQTIIPVSKKNQQVYNYITQVNAKTVSESFIGENSDEVVSGLITGSGWDVTMNWIGNNGYDVSTNSGAWGNYNNSTEDAATNSGSLQTTGKNEAWKAKNIYDLAGNCWEYISEKNTANSYNPYVFRGGSYNYSSSTYPASIRGIYKGVVGGDIAFRFVLYLK